MEKLIYDFLLSTENDNSNKFLAMNDDINDDIDDDQSDSMSSTEAGPLIALSMMNSDDDDESPSKWFERWHKIDSLNLTGQLVPCSSNGQFKSGHKLTSKQINHKSSSDFYLFDSTKLAANFLDNSIVFLPSSKISTKSNIHSITYQCNVFTSKSNYDNFKHKNNHPSKCKHVFLSFSF